MASESKIRRLTWEEVSDASKSLVENILEKQSRQVTTKIILAVAKGGLIPAGLLAQALPRATVKTIHVSSYSKQGEKLGSPKIAESWDYAQRYNASEVLVVDDICDSGDTFSALRLYLPKAEYAALFLREDFKGVRPNYKGWIALKDEWLEFPWERI